ncbi:MAG TPA: hypothetical protein VGO79_08390, partial [Thermoanaerobaculia bacterium]
MESLTQLAARLAERLDLLGPLDSLGDHRQTHRATEVDDAARERRESGRARVVKKGAVDLQDVDRQALQVGERRVSGAEVVDADVEAQVPQGPQGVDRRADVGHQHALGHLEAHQVGGHAGVR